MIFKLTGFPEREIVIVVARREERMAVRMRVDDDA
jgi:hypothetical protein